MSFLSNIFDPTLKTNQWPAIIADITSEFQEVKKRWFNECVVAIDLGLFSDKQETVKVICTELGGAGALAITAYQICRARAVISKNGYISKTSIPNFVDSISGRVSGAQINEILNCVKRYEGTIGETNTQQFRFGVDVARYIINQEPPLIVSLHVASLAEKLSALSDIAIVNAFGDRAKVHKLSRQITLLDEQIWPNI